MQINVQTTVIPLPFYKHKKAKQRKQNTKLIQTYEVKPLDNIKH